MRRIVCRRVGILNKMMAACLNKLAQASPSCSSFLAPVLPVSQHQLVRHLRFRNYADPILDKKQLQEPLHEDDPRNFKPIRASFPPEVPTAFKHPRVEKFTNIIMLEGKKEIARGIIADAFERIKRIQVKKWLRAKSEEDKNAIECNPFVIFDQAIENCRPMLRLRQLRRGGILYQVPSPITDKFAIFTSMKWIRDTAREKNMKMLMGESLAKEILDAFHNEGRVVKKKQELHRQCEANRAYAHYRWS